MGGKGSGTPTAALLKLDGTQIDFQGNISETDFFKFLNTPAEQFLNLEKTMTPTQALKFRNHIVKMRVGTSAAMPMLCGGNKCPIKTCPFHDGGGYPIAEPCPIEGNLIATWTRSYIEDLGVNVESRTEMILVNKLVECDIIDYRANVGLSTDEEAWTLLKIDITNNGKSITETTNAHPLLEVKERAQRARHQVLESLAATRKEKYKRAAALGKRDDKNLGDHFADLKKALSMLNSRASGVSIEELKKQAEALADNDTEDKIIDADWETDDEI